MGIVIDISSRLSSVKCPKMGMVTTARVDGKARCSWDGMKDERWKLNYGALRLCLWLKWKQMLLRKLINISKKSLLGIYPIIYPIWVEYTLLKRLWRVYLSVHKSKLYRGCILLTWPITVTHLSACERFLRSPKPRGILLPLLEEFCFKNRNLMSSDIDTNYTHQRPA